MSYVERPEELRRRGTCVSSRDTPLSAGKIADPEGTSRSQSTVKSREGTNHGWARSISAQSRVDSCVRIAQCNRFRPLWLSSISFVLIIVERVIRKLLAVPAFVDQNSGIPQLATSASVSIGAEGWS